MQTLRINVAALLKEAAGGARDHEVGAPAASVAAMVPDARPGTDLVATARLLRSPRSIFARVRGHVEVTVDCSRCLEDAVAPLDIEFDAEYFPSIDVVTGSTLAVPDDEMAFAIDRNHELDLAEAVRQEVLVGLPMHPLCRPDCAGLCPHCGHDLNAGPCGCATDEGDQRLAGLRGLLDGAGAPGPGRKGRRQG